ncbi:hypothetical protein ACQ86B_05080 [Mycolicibacterium aichiense]|uniref:hypothetical protein n=1 Tax=Mycolicibacterium aichiense TaxID=1799 RepID=UPI003D66500C
MARIRQLLLLPAAAIGTVVAVLTAPAAAADQPSPSPLPQCETYDGSSIAGGQTTECETPGNVELNSTPQQFPGEEPFYGFPAFGFW